MSRSPDYDSRYAMELALAEAMERLELQLVPVCPEPAPVQSAAELAHARACFGVASDFDGLLDGMPGTSAHYSRQTRH